MYEEAQVFNSGGPEDVAAENKQKVCDYFGSTGPWSESCTKFNANEGESAQSLNSLLYYGQLGVSKKFQEPISYEDMMAGQKKSAPVDVKSIDQVPVTFWTAGNDAECPKKFNKRLFKQIRSEKLWYEHKGQPHDLFGWIRGDMFHSKLVAAIETGDPNRCEHENDYYSKEADAFYHPIIWQ